MSTHESLYEPSRHPARSFEDILASDKVPSPDFYREGANPPAALESYATSRYYDPAFFKKKLIICGQKSGYGPAERKRYRTWGIT